VADGPTFAGDEGRVCPRCGRDAFGAWCECGFELSSLERLPTRAEYEASEARSAPAAQRGPAPAASSRRLVIIASVLLAVIGLAVFLLLAAADTTTVSSGSP
jgi:ferric-dicitrate binding protein FerR (iron transport regulator)